MNRPTLPVGRTGWPSQSAPATRWFKNFSTDFEAHAEAQQEVEALVAEVGAK